MFISKIMKSEWAAWVPRTSQANVMEPKPKGWLILYLPYTASNFTAKKQHLQLKNNFQLEAQTEIQQGFFLIAINYIYIYAMTNYELYILKPLGKTALTDQFMKVCHALH